MMAGSSPAVVISGQPMLRREVIDEVGLFDETLAIAEDYEVWLRISLRYRRLSQLEEG